MKIRPVGAVLFHADRQTNMKLIFASRNFANVPNNSYSPKQFEQILVSNRSGQCSL
jgi:hypothetical protein